MPLKRTTKVKSRNTSVAYEIKPDGRVLYFCQTGKYATKEGVVRPPKFYLGQDHYVAVKKKAAIVASWKAASALGHKLWPPDVLKELAGKGIISELTATNSAAGAIIRVMNTVPQTVEQKTEGLDKLREAGLVPLGNVPMFFATLATQELTDPEVVTHLRKYLRSLAFDDPREALTLFDKLYHMSRPQDGKSSSSGPGIAINFGNMIEFDASESRQVEATVSSAETLPPLVVDAESPVGPTQEAT